MTLTQLIEREGCSLSAEEQRAAKEAAANAALDFVESGMRVGLGTGSTVAYFLKGLARKIERESLKIHGVPTSLETERLAREAGIPLWDRDSFAELENDLCVDGADRVNSQGALIKGGGGALLREKMVAAHSARLCILVDATKLETTFGESFALPVECLPFGIESTMRRLAEQGCVPTLRETAGAAFVTDNGNRVVDCSFSSIPDPEQVQARLLLVPGVLEVGLFVSMLSCLLLGRPDGSCQIWDAGQEGLAR